MKCTKFDVWVAQIPLTGETVIPIHRLSDVSVKRKSVSFRAPNDSNRQVKNIIVFEGGDEKGELFYTLDDLKQYLTLSLDFHTRRLDKERAILEDFERFITDL